jgi:replicative DNA helicase
MKNLPNNNTAERAMLGILAGSPSLIEEIEDNLFFNPIHELLFKTLKELVRKEAPADHLDHTHIRAELESNGKLQEFGDTSMVFEIFGMNLGRASYPYYRTILAEAASYRRFIRLAIPAIAEAERMTTPLEEIIADLQTASTVAEVNELPQIKKQVMMLLDELERNTPHEYFQTGIYQLDNMLGGGLQRKEMLVVAAPTSRGKSLLLGQATVASVIAGKRTAFFTLEMPAFDVIKRFAANMSGYPIRANCDISTERSRREMDAQVKQIAILSDLPIHIFDNVSDLDTIMRTAKSLKQKHGLDLVVVDYIQRVEAEGTNREQAVSTIARTLKNFALVNDCCVMTASQMNDDGQVRESRAIGHEADILINIADKGADTILTVGKNRRGESGKSLVVTRRGELGRFDCDAR